MALVGMNVTVAENVLSRLRSSSARTRLQENAAELEAMVYQSYNPSFYGLAPGDGRVLSAHSIALAQSARGAIARALLGLDASVERLRADISGQESATARADGLDLGWNILDLFLPYPRLIRRYDGARGRYTYGAMIRNAADPRRNMTSRIVLSYRGPYNSNTWISRLNARWTASGWGWLKRTGESIVGRAGTFASGLISRIPNGAAQSVIRGAGRALGPIGVVVNGIFSYNDGYTDQMRRDEGSNYSASQMESRAQTRGAITAAATTVGTIGGAAIGAAVGGPVGAFVGGWLGGMVGGMVGDAISDAVLD